MWGALRSSITAVLEEEANAINHPSSTPALGSNPQGHTSVKGKQREAPRAQGEGPSETKVELNDVRESVCAFELFGAKVGRVLKAGLGGLVRAEDRPETKSVSVFESCLFLISMGSLIEN